MKLSEVFYGAAEVLRRDGWCKGRYTDEQGRHCLVGAIFKLDQTTYLDVQTARWLRVGGYFKSIIGCWPYDFNDNHCKSANDAIAALLIVADYAAAEGK